MDDAAAAAATTAASAAAQPQPQGPTVNPASGAAVVTASKVFPGAIDEEVNSFFK